MVAFDNSHVGHSLVARIITLFLTTSYSQEERPPSTEYEIGDGRDFQSSIFFVTRE